MNSKSLQLALISAICIFMPFNLCAEKLPIITDQSAIYTSQYMSAKPSPNGKMFAFIKRSTTGNLNALKFKYTLYLKDTYSKYAKPLRVVDHINISEVYWFPDGFHLGVISSGKRKKFLIINLHNQHVHQLDGLPKNFDSIRISPNGHLLAVSVDTENNNKVVSPRNVNGQTNMYLVRLNNQITAIQTINEITKNKYAIGGDSFNWGPDSHSLYFVINHGNMIDSEYHSWLASYDIGSKTFHILTPHANYYNWPIVSHNNKWLAYFSNEKIKVSRLYSRSYLKYRYIAQPCILNLKTNHRKCFGISYGHDTSILGWDEQDRHILISHEARLYDQISTINLQTGAVKNLSEHLEASSANLDKKGKVISFVTMNSNVPPHVVMSSVKAFHMIVISPPNKIKYNVGKTLRYTWMGTEHEKLEGLITVPSNYKFKKPLPLIVTIHGGPASHWHYQYNGMPYYGAVPLCIGCLASKGYIVFQPNEHGSSGYGPKFLTAVYRKIGQIDYQDIMMGIQSLIHHKMADKKRVGLWGWSYGGYLSSWINTQSSRFKAVVVGAGISNLVSLEGTSEYHSMTSYLGVPFWEHSGQWVRRSPVYNVSHAHAPVLIQGGSDDNEVPLSQSKELYYALKQAQKIVTFQIYKGQPHVFENPSLTLKAMNSMQKWFKANLKV